MAEIKVVGLEELKKEFTVNKDILILSPTDRWVQRYYHLDNDIRERARTLVKEYGHACAVAVLEDGKEYWVVDSPTGSGPGSTVVLLFNVECVRSEKPGVFRVATWNCGCGALTAYCYEEWFIEKPGSAMPTKYALRTVDDVLMPETGK